MRLIAVLLSLWLNRFPDRLDGFRNVAYVRGYLQWMRRQLSRVRIWDGLGGLVLVLAPIGIVVLLVQLAAGDWLLGLGELVLGTLALLFAFGPSRVDDHLERFVTAWRAGDLEQAREQAAWLAERKGDDMPDHALPGLALEGVFVRAHERLFGPVFWLAVLGPVGPVLFRLGHLCREFAAQHANAGPGFSGAVETFNWLTAWLPARGAALSFALVGRFVESFHGWNAARGFFSESQRAVLIGAGMGALGLPVSREDVDILEDTLREARSLIIRSAMIWIALIALLTLTGWLR